MTAYEEYQKNRYSAKDKFNIAVIIILIAVAIYFIVRFYKKYIVTKVQAINGITS